MSAPGKSTAVWLVAQETSAASSLPGKDRKSPYAFPPAKGKEPESAHKQKVQGNESTHSWVDIVGDHLHLNGHDRKDQQDRHERPLQPVHGGSCQKSVPLLLHIP